MGGIDLEGTAGSDGELNEDGEEALFQAETAHQPSDEQYQAKAVEDGELSSQDLSLVTKLIIFAFIVGGCYAFVKARTPRRTPAGRHGAYEKSGLP